MRKIKEILRLKWKLGLGTREVARSCLVSHSTVIEVLARAESARLSWPLPEDLDEGALEAKLYPPPKAKDAKPPRHGVSTKKPPKGMTLQLLWEEYKQGHPDGYQHTVLPGSTAIGPRNRRWCGRYISWREGVCGLRGPTVPVIDPSDGATKQAQISIAVLGASNCRGAGTRR